MNIALTEADAIREEVREHYAQRVRTQSGCCGPDCGCASKESDLYSAEELALTPVESAAVSYGCGNPTAIAGLKPGEVVLDLGSGGGIDVFLAAERVGPGGFVYGVDMTDEMLDLARRNAQRQGRTNVEFRKGYLEALPLPDVTVDVIISNCVVNLSPDKPQALREAFRVLRPGGRLAISDIVVDGSLDDLPVSEAQVRAALSWSGCVAGALTVDELKRQLAEAGFVDINIDFGGAEARRYTLEEVAASVTIELGDVPVAVARDLVSRFRSANIQARVPN